jgi:hypothetical protein
MKKTIFTTLRLKTRIFIKNYIFNDITISLIWLAILASNYQLLYAIYASIISSITEQVILYKIFFFLQVVSLCIPLLIIRKSQKLCSTYESAIKNFKRDVNNSMILHRYYALDIDRILLTTAIILAIFFIVPLSPEYKDGIVDQLKYTFTHSVFAIYSPLESYLAELFIRIASLFLLELLIIWVIITTLFSLSLYYPYLLIGILLLHFTNYKKLTILPQIFGFVMAISIIYRVYYYF